jgi:hypothetical protein
MSATGRLFAILFSRRRHGLVCFLWTLSDATWTIDDALEEFDTSDIDITT